MPSLAAAVLLLLQLQLLLLSPCNSKTIPAPTDRSSRIGIVGTGPAGLHMAYLLRGLGYKNLRLLEADDRVGGRSVSLPDLGGVVHEMAACYVTSDYDQVRRLAKWAGQPLHELLLPASTITLADESKLSLPQFFARRVCSLLNISCANPAKVRAVIVDAATRYAKLHASFFSVADGYGPDVEFPLRRPKRILDCSITEFLKRHNLMALEPLFLVGMTSQGYGSPADTSAMYGMMWMTPSFINDLLVPREKSKLALLAGGYQRVWPKVQRRLGVDIRFNAKVSQVKRSRSRVTVTTEDGRKEDFDWLIWTPDISATANKFKDLSKTEKRLFGKLRARQFSTQLLDFPEGAPMQEAVTYFMPNLGQLHPSPLAPWAARNSAKALGKPTAASNNTLVAYFLSDTVPAASPARHFGAWSGARVRQTFTFRYLPRFSVRDVAAGAPWDILEKVQGRKRVWFAGHSVVFDSVKSVMNYNKMLVYLAFPQYKSIIDRL